MQVFIAFLILAIVAAAWTGLFLPGNAAPQTQASVSQAQSTSLVRPVASGYYSSPVSPVSSASSVSINTFIKFGPRDNEVIDETNRVVFEFGAEVSPANTQGQISFETKLVGFDSSWQEVYYPQRTIDLPGGTKEYTFLVRAKINNIVDPTPATRSFELNISPSFSKVKIYSVRPADAYANPSVIVLTTELGNNEKIDITGWKLTGHYGSYIIPKGIEEFNPITTLYSPKDILIKKGDVIYISSGSNPLGPTDWSFRYNKCMGYLDNFVNSLSFLNFYNLSLKSCPRPQTLPSNLSRNCQDYISHLGTCGAATSQGEQDYNLLNDSQCLAYMDSNLNYGGCFINYYRDQDFWKSQWHIYMNRIDNEIMDTQVDTVYLYDRTGLLISEYSYGQTGSVNQYYYPTSAYFNSVIY